MCLCVHVYVCINAHLYAYGIPPFPLIIGRMFSSLLSSFHGKLLY
jgi:hypothetical protein